MLFSMFSHFYATQYASPLRFLTKLSHTHVLKTVTYAKSFTTCVVGLHIC